jgi:uncharacterized protein involved in exopolysaccharide biosynthesis
VNVGFKDSDELDDVNLGRVLTRLWQRRWWLVCIAGLCTLAFAVGAFLMTPIYRSAAILVPAGSERGSAGILGSAALGQLSGLASLAGISLASGDTETEEALAVLRSRQFTERFIDENHLMPKLFADKWDSANNRWKGAERNRPTPAKAYEYFNDRVRRILQDKKTGFVTLQIDWRDRYEAALWANELVQRLNDEMRTRAISEADSSVAFLEKELSTTSEIGTQAAINRLIETQIRRRMLATVSHEFSFRVADKAMVPDADDPIRPKKLLLVILGGIVGICLGCAAALTGRIGGSGGEIRAH